MAKHLIDVLTKSTKYVTGYTPATRFGKREAVQGTAKDIDGKYNYHIGNDYNTPSGTKLYAPTDGEFLATVRDGWGGGYGNYILFYSPRMKQTYHMAHLADIAPLEGKKIKEGQYIGATGNTGASSGPHLHLGVARGKKTNTNKGKYRDGTWINPSEVKIAPAPKPEPKPEDKPTTLKVGDKVQIKDSAKKYATGENIPARYKAKAKYTDTIQEISKGRVLLKGIYSWVKVEDIVGYKAPTVPKPPTPKPPAKPKRNEYGQNIQVGDTIYFSYLYTAVSGGKVLSPSSPGIDKSYTETITVNGKKVRAFKAKVSKIYPKKTGYTNPYELVTKNGKSVYGRTRPVNTYRKA